MGGKQDKRQQPGTERQEQQPSQRPGQDPVHPGPGTPSRGKRPEETERRREEDLLRDERNPHHDDF